MFLKYVKMKKSEFIQNKFTFQNKLTTKNYSSNNQSITFL